MAERRDALAGAAKLALEIRDIAARVGDGAVCTSGGVVCRPGIVTSVVETAEQLLDQRHLDADKLARLLAQAKEAAQRFAAEERIDVEWERIWSIEPILFDDTLVGFAEEAIAEVAGNLASAPVRPAARRRRGRAGGRADGDGLRPEPPRPLAHEARGHEARSTSSSPWRRSTASPREDDRLGRGRRRR